MADFVELDGAHYRADVIASVTPFAGGGANVVFTVPVVVQKQGEPKRTLLVEDETAEQIVSRMQDAGASQ